MLGFFFIKSMSFVEKVILFLEKWLIFVELSDLFGSGIDEIYEKEKYNLEMWKLIPLEDAPQTIEDLQRLCLQPDYQKRHTFENIENILIDHIKQLKETNQTWRKPDTKILSTSNTDDLDNSTNLLYDNGMNYNNNT